MSIKQNSDVLQIKSLNHHVLNVIFMHRTIFNTVSNAFWSKFYKLSPCCPTRLSNLNYIKNAQTKDILIYTLNNKYRTVQVSNKKRKRQS